MTPLPVTKNVYSKESAFYFSFQKTGGERSNHWFILIVLSSLLLPSLRQQLVLVLCFYQVTKQWIIFRFKSKDFSARFLTRCFQNSCKSLVFEMVQSITPYAV